MEKALFLVMAGGEGKRLRRLAGSLPKPLVRFGSSATLIDFTLYNCLASGAREVVVLTQYQGELIERHLAQEWQSAFAAHGAHLSTLAGAETPAGQFRGTADAVRQALRRHPGVPEHVVVLAADHVYRMDYNSLLSFHRGHGAAATVGTVELEWEKARGLGLVSAMANGRVSGFLEKPEGLESWILQDRKPLSSMGIYAFNRRALLRYLEDEPEVLDFGLHLLPRLSRDRELYAHRFLGPDGRPGYWRDLGTPLSFWQTHMEILNGHGHSFFAADPLPKVGLPLPPGHLVHKSFCGEQWIYNSLISPSAKIGNALIEDSVIGPDVVIEDGSSIEKSVILDGAVIRKWTELDHALVGPGLEIKQTLHATHEIALGPELRAPHRHHAVAEQPPESQPQPDESFPAEPEEIEITLPPLRKRPDSYPAIKTQVALSARANFGARVPSPATHYSASSHSKP